MGDDPIRPDALYTAVRIELNIHDSVSLAFIEGQLGDLHINTQREQILYIDPGSGLNTIFMLIEDDDDPTQIVPRIIQNYFRDREGLDLHSERFQTRDDIVEFTVQKISDRKCKTVLEALFGEPAQNPEDVICSDDSLINLITRDYQQTYCYLTEFLTNERCEEFNNKIPAESRYYSNNFRMSSFTLYHGVQQMSTKLLEYVLDRDKEVVFNYLRSGNSYGTWLGILRIEQIKRTIFHVCVMSEYLSKETLDYVIYDLIAKHAIKYYIIPQSGEEGQCVRHGLVFYDDQEICDGERAEIPDTANGMLEALGKICGHQNVRMKPLVQWDIPEGQENPQSFFQSLQDSLEWIRDEDNASLLILAIISHGSAGHIWLRKGGPAVKIIKVLSQIKESLHVGLSLLPKVVIISACQSSALYIAENERQWENLATEGNLQLMLSDTELLLSSKHGCTSGTGFYTESLIQTINAMAEAKSVKQIHEDAVERLLADPSYQNCPDDDKDKPLIMSTANLRVLLTPHSDLGESRGEPGNDEEETCQAEDDEPDPRREPGGGETECVEPEGGEQPVNQPSSELGDDQEIEAEMVMDDEEEEEGLEQEEEGLGEEIDAAMVVDDDEEEEEELGEVIEAEMVIDHEEEGIGEEMEAEMAFDDEEEED